ncbi:hypothetical protein F01_420625 [Burkholderia cenocepacia]|nr:hypothetical protein F01_420625 [Burkholderia cenocepacia]
MHRGAGARRRRRVHRRGRRPCAGVARAAVAAARPRAAAAGSGPCAREDLLVPRGGAPAAS